MYILCWCVSFDAVYPELPAIDLKKGVQVLTDDS